MSRWCGRRHAGQGHHRPMRRAATRVQPCHRCRLSPRQPTAARAILTSLALQVQRDRSPLHAHPIEEISNGKKGRTVPPKRLERGVGRTNTEVRRPPKVPRLSPVRPAYEPHSTHATLISQLIASRHNGERKSPPRDPASPQHSPCENKKDLLGSSGEKAYGHSSFPRERRCAFIGALSALADMLCFVFGAAQSDRLPLRLKAPAVLTPCPAPPCCLPREDKRHASPPPATAHSRAERYRVTLPFKPYPCVVSLLLAPV